MSLKLQNYQEVPPGGFRYLQPETKVWVTAPSWEELITAVKKHREANHIPVGTAFREEIEHQLCEMMPPETCMRSGGITLSRGRLTLEEVLRGTKTLLSWVMSGGNKVDQAEADRRAAICASCHFNQEFEGCSACNQATLRDLVVKIVGSTKSKHDSLLKNCLVCGCTNRAGVWLPLETLQKNTPSEVNQQFPDYCWKKETI